MKNGVSCLLRSILFAIAVVFGGCSGGARSESPLPAVPAQPSLAVCSPALSPAEPAPAPVAAPAPIPPDPPPVFAEPQSAPPPSDGANDDTAADEPRVESEAVESDVERTYVVRPLDTPSQIAQCFQIPISELRRLNHLRIRSRLVVGQVLRLPSSASAECQRPDTPGQLCFEPLGRTKLQELDPSCVRAVPSGKGLTQIARQYGTTVEELRRMNHLTCDTLLRGQKLLVCEHPRAKRIDEAKGTSSGNATFAEVAPIASIPPPIVCESALHAQPNGERIVFFANGDGPELLARYRRMLDSAHVRVEWKAVKVVFFDEQGQQSVRGKALSFGPMLAGRTEFGMLRSSLRGRRALARGSAPDDARVLGADLVCGQ